MAERRIHRAARTVAAFAATSVLMAAAAGSALSQQTAASMTGRDVQVMARALGFMRPTPTGEAWVAVLFAPGDPASRQDADRLTVLFGDGVRTSGAVLRARPISADALSSDARGYAALFLASGAPADAALAAARVRHIACVTAALELVEAGRCTVWVRSDPRVEIVVSHAAAQSCGIEIAAAFRMMIREN